MIAAARRVALALFAALAAAAPAAAAPPATLAAGTLTVGVNLPSEGFQVGIADGSRVIYARGLEIDLAKAIAQRLELTGGAAFVQSPFPALLTPGAAPAWDLALAEITITKARAANVDFSIPYMRADQGVLTSQYLRTTPRSRAALRGLRLCAERGTTSAQTIKSTIKPTRAALYADDVPTLMLYLQVGRCDAVVADLPMLATLKDRAPRRYGELAGAIRTGEEYGAALPKGSPLLPLVDRAIGALQANGTLGGLQRTWLSVDLAKVRVLR